MALKVIKMCCGGGCIAGTSLSSASRHTKPGNSLFMASIVLLLVCSFVGGKPFHSVGQAEVEDDTTQGSFKEKFPSLSELSGNDNEELLANLGFLATGHDKINNYAFPYVLDSNQRLRSTFPQQSHPSITAPINFGVHKRSLIGGLRAMPYPGPNDSAADDDNAEEQRLGSSSSKSIYDSAAAAPSPDAINSSSESNPGFRIRQKLLNLRNQYGDKWLSFVGPYAYRKRQILYRQCFFNPISCF